MGASGAGKSTLLYALSGMDKPTIGEIDFLGQEISKFTDDQLAVFRRKNCGFVFQQVYMMDKMSLMDNVLSEFHANGQSIVMVTHDLKSALRGNRIIYLKDGSICGECNLSDYQKEDTERRLKLDAFLKEMGY